MSSTFKKRTEEMRRKIRNRAATLAVGAVVATSFAPSQAHAQTRDDNSKVNTEVTFNASTGKFERVASSQTQNQQNGRTITLQEAQTMTQSGRGSATSAQGIGKSLPAYTQALIRERNYQILPEFQGGATTGLNRPEDGVIYACAVQDPSDANNVLFLPVAEKMYPAGNRDFITPQIYRTSKEKAYEMMTLNQGPYQAKKEYAVTLENMERERDNEQRSVQRKIEQDRRAIRQKDEQARNAVDKATGPFRRAAEGLERVNQTGRRMENAVNQTQRTVNRIRNGGRGN